MNKLEHINEFRRALNHYQPSKAAKELLAQTKLVLFVGPSSSGRNTIINELIKSDKYHFIVSDTTRKPRINNNVIEQNGREYWFRSETDMLKDLEDGQFLEAAIIHEQQVSGISIRELTNAAKENKISLNEIEVVGADNIYAAKPDTLFLFVLPPSFDEWMVRMAVRGELPTAEIRRRLTSAVDEITTALSRDYYQFVVNDTFMHTAERVKAMIAGEPWPAEAQQAGKAVAKEILEDTRAYLANTVTK